MKFIKTTKYLVDIKYLMYVSCDEEELFFKFTNEFQKDQDEHFYVWSRKIDNVKKVYENFCDFLNSKNKVLFDLDSVCETYSVYE